MAIWETKWKTVSKPVSGFGLTCNKWPDKPLPTSARKFPFSCPAAPVLFLSKFSGRNLYETGQTVFALWLRFGFLIALSFQKIFSDRFRMIFPKNRLRIHCALVALCWFFVALSSQKKRFSDRRLNDFSRKSAKNLLPIALWLRFGCALVALWGFSLQFLTGSQWFFEKTSQKSIALWLRFGCALVLFHNNF